MENGKETPKEKASKLGWLGESKKEPNGKPPRLPDLSTMLVVGVISLVMALLVVFLVAPTKGNLQTLRGELDTRFSTASSALDTKLANYQATVTGEVSNLKSRVDSFSSQLSSLESRISGLSGLEGRVNTAISGIDSTVAAKTADLEARVAALEEEEEEEVASSSEEVSCKLKMWGDMILPANADPGVGSHLNQSLKATITNNTGRDLEDVVFTLVIYPSSYDLPGVVSATLTGGMTNWLRLSPQSWAVIFQNSWGFDLDTGETKTVMLTLDVQYGVGAHSAVYYEVEMECVDYD